MALISVIMPVYNAAAFLESSVGSVLAQTFTDLELICFNDASTDRSIDILRGFEKADSRVKIIDSPVNVRQGGGRNRALRLAAGRYVMFLDADDSLRPDALELCINTAHLENADMVVFDYSRVSPSDGSSADVCQLGADAASLRGDGLRRRLIEKTTPVWSAMYERRLITDNELFFPEGVFYEDNAVALAIQLSAANPVKINAPLYRYRVDNASVTRSVNNYRFFNRLGSAVTLLGHLRRLGLYEKFAAEIDFLFMNQYLTHTVYGCVYRFDRVPMLRHNYACRTVSRYIGDYHRNPCYWKWPLKHKLKLALHIRFPRLIKMAQRIVRGTGRGA